MGRHRAGRRKQSTVRLPGAHNLVKATPILAAAVVTGLFASGAGDATGFMAPIDTPTASDKETNSKVINALGVPADADYVLKPIGAVVTELAPAAPELDPLLVDAVAQARKDSSVLLDAMNADIDNPVVRVNPNVRSGNPTTPVLSNRGDADRELGNGQVARAGVSEAASSPRSEVGRVGSDRGGTSASAEAGRDRVDADRAGAETGAEPDRSRGHAGASPRAVAPDALSCPTTSAGENDPTSVRDEEGRRREATSARSVRVSDNDSEGSGNRRPVPSREVLPREEVKDRDRKEARTPDRNDRGEDSPVQREVDRIERQKDRVVEKVKDKRDDKVADLKDSVDRPRSVREEVKEIRQEARDKVKEVRQDAREEKKEAREEKRETKPKPSPTPVTETPERPVERPEPRPQPETPTVPDSPSPKPTVPVIDRAERAADKAEKRADKAEKKVEERIESAKTPRQVEKRTERAAEKVEKQADRAAERQEKVKPVVTPEPVRDSEPEQDTPKPVADRVEKMTEKAEERVDNANTEKQAEKREERAAEKVTKAEDKAEKKAERRTEGESPASSGSKDSGGSSDSGDTGNNGEK